MPIVTKQREGALQVHFFLIISLHFNVGPRSQRRFCKLENVANPAKAIFLTYSIGELSSATKSWTRVSTDVTYLLNSVSVSTSLNADMSSKRSKFFFLSQTKERRN